MGCWNHTCMLSQMHVNAGEDVVSFWVHSAGDLANQSFCYSSAQWVPLPFPVYGQYDDYGSVENLTGPMLPLLLQHARKILVDREWGENKCHDHPVNSKEITLEEMYEIDSNTNRLLVKHPHNPAIHLVMKHVVIKKSLFDKIINEFFFEKYTWPEGYEKPSVVIHTTFADVVATIQDDVQWIRDQFAGDKMMRYYTRDNPFYSNKEAPKSCDFIFANGGEGNYMMARNELFEYSELPLDQLVQLVTELIKFNWLLMFMAHSRKSWSPQTGQGGQSQETLPYELMGNYLLEQVAAQNLEYGEDE